MEKIEETETYVKDIADNWDEISNITNLNKDGKYTEWERMLDFTMYQALTAFAINKWKMDDERQLYFDDVPISLFEEYFRKNLMTEGNEEYLSQYKGFKNQPK